MQRVTLTLLAVWLLSGCAQLIERQMASYKGSRHLNMDVGQYTQSWCSQAGCVSVTDWSDVKKMNGTEPLTKLTASLRVAIDQQLYEEDVVLEFEPLSDNSPIIVMFPGYGMRAEALGLKALYFRSRGFRPLVVASPTEQKPFNFGLSSIEVIADYLTDHYSTHDVYAYGFSMGSLAVAELSQRFPVQGAIVVAPMLDFDDAASQLIDLYRRNTVFARAIPQQSFQQGLERLALNASVERKKLFWPYAVTLLPSNTLVVGSYYDSISNFSLVSAEVARHHRHFYLAGINLPSFEHPAMAMPLEPAIAPIDAWFQLQPIGSLQAE